MASFSFSGYLTVVAGRELCSRPRPYVLLTLTVPTLPGLYDQLWVGSISVLHTKTCNRGYTQTEMWFNWYFWSVWCFSREIWSVCWACSHAAWCYNPMSWASSNRVGDLNISTYLYTFGLWIYHLICKTTGLRALKPRCTMSSCQ